MSSHPVNLALRFLLEIAALLALGAWGRQQADGWLRVLLTIGIPLVAAVAWGTFAVPKDPSRSGSAPVPVPGLLRLALELALFGAAAWALFDLGLARWGALLALIVAIHYFASYDRVLWLLKR